MSNKKYGLILPEKGKVGPTFQASRNVFGNDSDSDEDFKNKPVLLRPSDNINRQAKITQEKAVIEDPTVYQYDEIYDEMVGCKEKKKNKNKEDAKPKYIENLMKSANKRKIENERRIERQIQKEREKEGEEFKDKEVFVTTAYKKKLQEMREEEEREKREEYLENIGDVTKQKDLGGFYRHLYEQKLGSDKPQLEEKQPIKEEIANESHTDAVPASHKSESNQKRNYRKRKSTESKAHYSDGEIEDSDDEINRVNIDDIKSAKKKKPSEENIDADSDFSIDESSDEGTETKPEVKQQILKEVNKEKKSDTPERDINKENISKKIKEEKPKNVPEMKPKIDIWKKRTVGIIFDEALKRYYERKAARA